MSFYDRAAERIEELEGQIEANRASPQGLPLLRIEALLEILCLHADANGNGGIRSARNELARERESR